MIQFAHDRAVPAAHCYVSEGRLRTLGSSFFALLLQAAARSLHPRHEHRHPQPHRRLDADLASSFSLILGAAVDRGPGASSSTSGGRFDAQRKQSAQFLDVFRRSNKFSEVQAVCRSLGDSPLVGLFQAGYAELTAQLRQTGAR